MSDLTSCSDTTQNSCSDTTQTSHSSQKKCQTIPIAKLMQQAHETGNIVLEQELKQLIIDSGKKIINITDIAGVISLISYIDDRILEICIPCCARSKIINAINEYMLKLGLVDTTSGSLFDHNTVCDTAYIDETVIPLLMNIKHIIQLFFSTICCCNECNFEKNKWRKTTFSCACAQIFGEICIVYSYV